MKITTRISAAGVVLAAASALLAAAPAQAATVRSADHGVVFAQSDNPSGNTVVAYDRAADGALTQAGVYSTGGLGGVLQGSAVDHLASQHSLVYDQAHHLLYTVNAGSDTVSVFQVDGDHLLRTQVISSGGSFPVSIAVRGDRVYVLNALDGGSVQGFVREGCTLVAVADWHRGLGLAPVTGPMQFTHTPAQVSFTPDGSALVVTTKAGGNSIDVFPFDDHGAPSAQPVTNAVPNAVPFGFVFDAAGRLVVTEAGPNAVATFTLARDGKVTPVSSVATGQAATCWIVRTGNKLYASNAGSGTLSGYRERHGMLTSLGTTMTGAGTTDAAVSPDGRDLYVQTGAAGVVDGFRVHGDGSLTPIGSVTVPDGIGGEGIVVA